MDDLLIFQLLYDLWSLLSCIVTLSCFLQMQSLHWLLLRDIMMIYFGIIFLYDGKITRIYYPLQILSSLFLISFLSNHENITFCNKILYLSNCKYSKQYKNSKMNISKRNNECIFTLLNCWKINRKMKKVSYFKIKVT